MKPSPLKTISSDITTDGRAEVAADADFTAYEQLAYLKSVIKDWNATQAVTASGQTSKQEPAPLPAKSSDNPANRRPFASLHWLRAKPSIVAVKSILALTVAVMLGWQPVQRLLATTSAEATVNARLVILRAPIGGEVTVTGLHSEIGTEFAPGQQILTISDPRADAQHLNNLDRDRDRVKTEIDALEGRQRVLLANLADLTAQQERFRVGRIEQLDQRTREIDADIAAAQAQSRVSVGALTRAETLRASGTVSQAALDKAIGEAEVAEQNVNRLNERRKGILVELNAARNGTFVGDSYNDTPQSAQRKMEVELGLAEVRARIDGSRQQLASIANDRVTEAQRYERLSTAVVRSTVRGRVWELLTAPGEHVNAGQDLMKVLDCGSAIVTASVSETVYQRLSIGQAAKFRRRSDNAVLEGSVAGLNGLAAVDSNSAILQGLLSREPYHVSLKFPALTAAADCQIGRTGLVEFDTPSRSFSSFIP